MLSRLGSQRVGEAERETAPLVKPTAGSPLHEGGRHRIRDERTKTNEGGDAVVASRSCCAQRMCTVFLAALLLATGVAVYRERGMRKGAQTLSVLLQEDLIAARSAAQHGTETHAKHAALIKQLQEQNSRLGQKYTESTQKFSLESAARSNNAVQLGDMRAELKRRTNEHEATLAAHAAQAEKWSAVQAKWDAVNELLATSFAEKDGNIEVGGGAASSSSSKPLAGASTFAIVLRRLQNSLGAYTSSLVMLSHSKYWDATRLMGSFVGYWVVGGPVPARPPLSHAMDITQFRVFGPCVGVAKADARPHRVDPFLLNTTVGDDVDERPCSATLAVGAECEIFVQACDAAGTPVAGATGASFRIRLFGDAIVAGAVSDEGGGLYRGVVTPRDAGVYVVEVFGGEMQYSDDTAREAYKLYETIFRSAAPVCVAPSAVATAVVTTGVAATPRICMSGDEGAGRWRHVRDGECARGSGGGGGGSGSDGEDAPCVGNIDTGLLNDATLSNLDFVWAPDRCVYRIFTPSELRACMQRRDIRFVVAAGGHSILREMFYNLETLFVGAGAVMRRSDYDALAARYAVELYPISDAVKARLAAHDAAPVTIHQPKVYQKRDKIGGIEFRFTDALDTPPDEIAHSLVVVSFPLPAQLIAVRQVNEIVEQWKNALDTQKETCARAVVCIAYLHPAIHRGKTHIKDERPTGTSYLRSRRVHDGVAPYARQLGFHVVDAFPVGEPRWWGSWDGMHYSQNRLNFDNKDGWVGGVSMMFTQMIVNVMCNDEID